MGFSLLKRKRGWRVRHRVQGKTTTTRLLRLDEYPAYGLRADMTAEEVATALANLRADERAKQMTESYARIQAKIEYRRTIESSWLPPHIVSRFEAEILPETTLRRDRWLIAKELIAKIAIAPDEWHWRPKAIYDLFIERGDSIDYARRLLRIVNKWGAYYSRTLGKTFLPVPSPDGPFEAAIKAAHNRLKPSRRTVVLTVDKLRDLRPHLSEKAYNGLYAMLWLGLRPEELRQLLVKGWDWELSFDDKRFKACLHLFQHKLERAGIDRELCWKVIPFCEPEQLPLIEIIEHGKIEPVSAGALKKFGLTERSARKGFALVMHLKGYPEGVFDRWLGHVGATTLRRHYEEKRIAYWEPPVQPKKLA